MIGAGSILETTLLYLDHFGALLEISYSTTWCFMELPFLIRCRLESTRQTCGTRLRCRQKCTEDFSVMGGGTTRCTGGRHGQFEGDSCTAICHRLNFRHRGDAKAYCKDGMWINQRNVLGSRPAEARCVSVGRYSIDQS